MKSKLRTLSDLACALAMITISASCKQPADTIPSPSKATGQASFPGGALFTSADLIATPAVLPVAPPAYANLTCSDDGNDQYSCRQQFARFAWRQFIYLNSPVAQRQEFLDPPVFRGTIDPSRNFAASGDPQFYQSDVTHGGPLHEGKNLLVWETFAHRSELFPSGYAPLGYNYGNQPFETAPPAYAFQNVQVKLNRLVRFNNLDETTQIGQNQLFFPVNGKTPSANPYDDCLVLFQARVNSVELNYIKGIYNSDSPPIAIELPPNEGNAGESIEIKSAWRDMSCGSVDATRYHTAEALYYTKDVNGQYQANVGTFGLVGLHILRKMQNYPTFVYTTFEHVDNLKSGLYFITLYNDLEYSKDNRIKKAMAIVNNGTQLTSLQLPTAGTVQQGNGYPFVPGATLPPSLASFAGPIMAHASPALTQAVMNVNKEIGAVMANTQGFPKNSVWQYYSLAGVQILPVNEDQSTTGKRSPLTEDFFLANNAIESSQPGVQLFKGAVSDPGVRGASANQLINERGMANIQNVPGLQVPGVTDSNKLVMGGCMGCHGNAQYPSDKEGVPIPGVAHKSIFNFLIGYSTTMRGTGFSADARNESPADVKAKASKYMRRPR
jgi:hypothetical protein